jgi:high potential iron-sulfur protein
MPDPAYLSRRRLLQRLALGTPLAALGVRAALAAELPLLAADSAAAKALKYVEDAQQAKDASPGSSCANCGLYAGAAGSARGPCQLFAGQDVLAAGWCSAWAPQL